MWPALSIDRESERWRLLGRDSKNDFVSVEGRIGDRAVSERHWKAPSEDASLVLGVSNGATVVWESRVLFELPIPWIPYYFEPAPRTASRFWRLDGDRRSPLADSHATLYCLPSGLIGTPALCSAFDGGTTRFFALDPDIEANGRLKALAAVPGWALLEDAGDRGWFSVSQGRDLVAFRPAQGEGILVAPSDGERPYQLAVGETVVAAVSSSGKGDRVRVYSLPKPSTR
jgi:hypothetical protein